ncbi:MAG: hypothetical protein IJX52_02325 [Oscillibacter sp.]|nr:hypothetical protein [Oscillibacter sp.]
MLRNTSLRLGVEPRGFFTPPPMSKARQAESHEAELQSLHSEIDSLTANPDKMYMDRLTGLLAEAESKPRLARGFDRLFRDIF